MHCFYWGQSFGIGQSGQVLFSQITSGIVGQSSQSLQVELDVTLGHWAHYSHLIQVGQTVVLHLSCGGHSLEGGNCLHSSTLGHSWSGIVSFLVQFDV
jgi:hypothetical protein